jgi:hypothetical protein
MAALLVTVTITTNDFSPFHPTPHSPSGGSERGLLSSPNSRAEMRNEFRKTVPSA